MIQRTSHKCHLRHGRGPITIFQIYAPDSRYMEDVVEEFYDMLRSKIDAIPKNQIYMVMGDFNAKVGSDKCGQRQLAATD